LPSKICRLDLSFSLDVWCRSKWEKNPWKPKKIIYEPTDEKLTATAGLGPLIDAFMQSPEFTAFKACLPERIGNSSYSAEHLALIVLCGFWNGHDCLDDLEEFEHDPAVEDKLGGLATSKTIGNYLRDFEPEHVEKLRKFLTKQAFHYRTRSSCCFNYLMRLVFSLLTLF
jgi:hypothetical protein